MNSENSDKRAETARKAGSSKRRFGTDICNDVAKEGPGVFWNAPTALPTATLRVATETVHHPNMVAVHRQRGRAADVSEQLMRVSLLFSEGRLSDTEFGLAKKAILSRWGGGEGGTGGEGNGSALSVSSDSLDPQGSKFGHGSATGTAQRAEPLDTALGVDTKVGVERDVLTEALPMSAPIPTTAVGSGVDCSLSTHPRAAVTYNLLNPSRNAAPASLPPRRSRPPMPACMYGLHTREQSSQ